MKLGIVGWYGTETMGDRAILDGILAIINQIEHNNTVFLGSLFPFYSERTLLEEREVFRQTAPGTKVELFDVKNADACKMAIGECELLIMGGGPLMDIEELFCVERCFRYAKKRRIKTAIVGCGVGPLNNSDYRESVRRIFELSDAIYVRDELSVQVVNQLFGNSFLCDNLGDPAVISIEQFRKATQKRPALLMNFRDYPKSAYGAVSMIEDAHFEQLISYASEKYEEVILVPMHTFFVGGDDRAYLTKLARACRKENVIVVHKPMNLHELYDLFATAQACVGMRYHSVVMQTILNGNNVILEYTDSKNGKIAGFIKSVDCDGFYDNRIISLQGIKEWKFEDTMNSLLDNRTFKYRKSNMSEAYENAFKRLLD